MIFFNFLGTINFLHFTPLLYSPHLVIISYLVVLHSYFSYMEQMFNWNCLALKIVGHINGLDACALMDNH